MKEHSDSKSGSGDALHSGKHHGFKKKGNHRKIESPASELFKGVGFFAGRVGPELYVKNINKLGLCQQAAKHGFDEMTCLMNGKVIKVAAPALPNKWP